MRHAERASFVRGSTNPWSRHSETMTKNACFRQPFWKSLLPSKLEPEYPRYRTRDLVIEISTNLCDWSEEPVTVPVVVDRATHQSPKLQIQVADEERYVDWKEWSVVIIDKAHQPILAICTSRSSSLAFLAEHTFIRFGRARSVLQNLRAPFQ